ncbi:cardiolipin synthase ClsB [Methylibium sp.]|uniref:cardiolipin synthase ClsB n=1 Tax=Methylibium sp. TaxID=2067992 RepID=UPI003D0EA475
MNGRWVGGNRFGLLENGEAYFPRVFEAIAAARHEVLLETFILFEDKVGLELHAALLQAAQRGAQVDVTVDGYGSPDLSPGFVGALTAAGVRVHVFDPGTRLFGWRTNLFRRMHRKLVVVDGMRAFVGGINYAADHLADFGPEAKQDYAVEIEGPLVAHIQRFARQAIAQGRQGQPARRWFRRRAPEAALPSLAVAGDAQAMFVTRDNREHPQDIERHYRVAIRTARHRLVIANAYFFPGYRLLKELRRAARRGVEVSLILQGEPDMAIVKTAAEMLYHHLLRAGVHIYEYCERPLHGKVAVADDEWATVGSSNLDPLSLSLNLEANVMIRDRAFNRQLGERLEHLMAQRCKRIAAADLQEPGLWRLVRSYFVFHFLRHYPAWAGWLPAHTPRLASAPHAATAGTAGTDRLTEPASS